MLARACRVLACLALVVSSAHPCAAQALPYWNAQWGRPQDASLGLGLALGRTKGRSFQISRRSVLLEARPGLDGGALHLGWLPFSASTHGFQFAGVALKGTLLRTWGSPPRTLAASQTYAGAELHAAWVVKASIGVLWRVSGHAGKSSLVTWSLGIGL